MNIEEFYEKDERRRESEELELGSDWHDAQGNRYELSYVVVTGELYTMAAPLAAVVEDPFGDSNVGSEPVGVLVVDVIATLPTVDDVHRVIAGWEGQMSKPSSYEWLIQQVQGYATR